MGDKMIPATPEPGTADPNPLVLLRDYQLVTKDVATNEDDFNYFLADALDEIQRKTGRTFLYARYEERLFITKNGQVYGSAVPYDTSKPVVNPGTSTDPEQNVGIFQGNGIWVGWYSPMPSLPVFVGVVPPQTDILYWGGFVGPGADDDLKVEHLIPSGLKRVICRVIWYMANPAVLTALPGGTKSTSVNGVSVSGSADLSMMITADPQLGRDIKHWRLPKIPAFAGQTAPR